ncbi:MAG: hypothetical protein C0601_02945 [Candidatus Muiribacterium halophilum]|uniref:Uncharacterized protein n=1 Tax=Muiribacterium halophilum TaxID=2053465 RepID=A0A2N5ZKA2_MUIH1|nr:MAG: hypothetical protein C0601_02945 [Candidatus Muirbacterium halophilum]
MKKILFFLIINVISFNIFSIDLNPYKQHYRDYQESIKQIQKKDTDKATEYMIDALEKAEAKKLDDVDALSFNVGNLMKQKGDKEKAEDYYNNALNGFSDNKDKADTLFNLGNMYFKDNKLKEAIESYVHSYKLNPTEDLKYNLNLAIKKLKQQKQDQKQNEDNDKKNKKDQDKDKQNKNDKNNEKDKDKEKQDKGQKQDKKQQDKDKDDKKDNQQQKDNESQQQKKEEKYNQQQVIKNADQQEKEALKQFIKKELGEVRSNGKDW